VHQSTPYLLNNVQPSQIWSSFRMRSMFFLTLSFGLLGANLG